jgi:hypothetical protein
MKGFCDFYTKVRIIGAEVVSMMCSSCFFTSRPDTKSCIYFRDDEPIVRDEVLSWARWLSL